MHTLSVPILGNFLQKYISPSECYLFWEKHRLGFSRPCRDIQNQDVTQRDLQRIPALLEQVVTKKKPHLLLKVTGWPRIGFFNSIFPKSKFIHIIRDGRAVAQSLMDIPFWKGWEGPEKWRWGTLSDAYQQEWEHFDRSFAVLAGIQWKILMDAAQQAMLEIDSDRSLVIRYEDLCSEPILYIKKAVKFLGMPWSLGYERDLNNLKTRATNDKWKDRLNQQQQLDLNEILQAHLLRYGYRI